MSNLRRHIAEAGFSLSITQIPREKEMLITRKIKSAAWRKIPSAYLVCEDDHGIPVQAHDA
jgi:hypothetical protein